ncbi:MAG TPA: hypothetical protein DCG73_09390 [Morganella sp. (in: Bacteria)]|nr:hypothetical protein [Morganella sp. (in: enterobacteria)]
MGYSAEKNKAPQREPETMCVYLQNIIRAILLSSEIKRLIFFIAGNIIIAFLFIAFSQFDDITVALC